METVKSNEIDTPKPAIEVKAETKATPKPKAKAELCRACGVCDKTEPYEHKDKKFVKCKGCGFLVSVV